VDNNYDIVMYFYWAPPHVVPKYLNLHNTLKKHCRVLTIIGEGEFGISKEIFSLFNKEHLEDVILEPVEGALKRLKETNFKVGVFSSNGRKGFVNPDGSCPPSLGSRWPNIGKDIAIAKEKNALTVQISEMMSDIYYGGADIVSLISPLAFVLHLQPQEYGTYAHYEWRPFDANPQPKYIYSNCLLWDAVEEYMPYHLTRDEFCKKYGLDKDKDILLYLPSMIDSISTGVASEVYRRTCKMDNVIIKLHPKEYKRLLANRFDNKWSYEVCGVTEPVRILEEIDAHWAYKYAACGISNQSSVAMEVFLYETPFLYVQPPRFRWSSFFLKFGHKCNLDEFETFIKNKKYRNEVPGLKEFYKSKMMINPDKTAAEILKSQLLELLGCVK
tara:strand:- start:7621 stop:8778 length:1158 start_codon:yes stop_codon:yes gene_type:complete